MRSAVLTWLIVFVGLIGAPARAGNLLFVSDTTTDLDIPVVLQADGHVVTVVTDDYATGNATLKADLSSFDAVYWSTSQVVHDDLDLLATLTSWVESGGRIFVTGADGTYGSYNPTTAFVEFLGASDGWDGGYVLSPIADVRNSVTTGDQDIRGVTPLTPGDSDSVCGPLAPGTVGIAAPTVGSGPCPGNEAFGWLLRSLGAGEIAWVESGNFTSTIPPNEPLWTDTDLGAWGAYNAAVRNFAVDGVFSDGIEDGSLIAWSAAVGELDPDLEIHIGLPLGPTQAGTCSTPAATLLLENAGGSELEIQSLELDGRFFFDLSFGQSAGPIPPIPRFHSDGSVIIYFCPDVPTGSRYQGSVVVVSNDPSSPEIFELTGVEFTPAEIGTAPYEDGDYWTFPDTVESTCSAEETLTIFNTGVSKLTVEGVESSDSQFVIVNPPPPGTTVLPAETYDLRLQFCPDSLGAHSGTLTIDHDAINEPDPIVIMLEGLGI